MPPTEFLDIPDPNTGVDERLRVISNRQAMEASDRMLAFFEDENLESEVTARLRTEIMTARELQKLRARAKTAELREAVGTVERERKALENELGRILSNRAPGWKKETELEFRILTKDGMIPWSGRLAQVLDRIIGGAADFSNAFQRTYDGGRDPEIVIRIRKSGGGRDDWEVISIGVSETP